MQSLTVCLRTTHSEHEIHRIAEDTTQHTLKAREQRYVSFFQRFCACVDAHAAQREFEVRRLRCFLAEAAQMWDSVGAALHHHAADYEEDSRTRWQSYEDAQKHVGAEIDALLARIRKAQTKTDVEELHGEVQTRIAALGDTPGIPRERHAADTGIPDTRTADERAHTRTDEGVLPPPPQTQRWRDTRS